MFINEEEFREEILKELNTISLKSIFTQTRAFNFNFSYTEYDGSIKVFYKTFSVGGNNFCGRKPHYSNARINIGKYNAFLPKDFTRSFLMRNTYAERVNIWCPHTISYSIDNKPIQHCYCHADKAMFILEPVMDQIKSIIDERINNKITIDMLQAEMNRYLSRKLDIQLDNLIKQGYENIDPDVCADRLEEIARILRKSKKLEFLE